MRYSAAEMVTLTLATIAIASIALAYKRACEGTAALIRARHATRRHDVPAHLATGHCDEYELVDVRSRPRLRTKGQCSDAMDWDRGMMLATICERGCCV